LQIAIGNPQSEISFQIESGKQENRNLRDFISVSNIGVSARVHSSQSATPTAVASTRKLSHWSETMAIVPSLPIEISGSLLPLGNKSGVVVKLGGGVAPVRTGNTTASKSVATAAAVVKITVRGRPTTEITDRAFILGFLSMFCLVKGGFRSVHVLRKRMTYCDSFLDRKGKVITAFAPGYP
jgi:hypothetical protein